MAVTETITRAGTGRRTLDLQHVLTVVHPPSLCGRFQLTDQPVVLGRKVDPPEGVRLAHATVSRRHLAIHWDREAGCHYAAELGSRNGSTLNGARLNQVPRQLRDNSVLRLGDVFVVYEVESTTTPDDDHVDRDAIWGEALSMASLRGRVGQMARDPSPVLIRGQSGAGKERVAGELHRLSDRTGRMVTLNCATLSATLIESQLFGHVRGAFTGAKHASEGFFQAADGGSLFLDEIGEMPVELQPKLLRAIESGEVTAVGSTQRRIVDVRVIAATNRNLAEEVEDGRFRRDLLARLSLWLLEVPSLHRRRVDVLAWIDRLAARWAHQRGHSDRPSFEFSPPAVETILLADWPENLRGLNRLVHELVHLQPGTIRREALPPWLLERAGCAITQSRRQQA